jgi:hypothetical protein
MPFARRSASMLLSISAAPAKMRVRGIRLTVPGASPSAAGEVGARRRSRVAPMARHLKLIAVLRRFGSTGRIEPTSPSFLSSR